MASLGKQNPQLKLEKPTDVEYRSENLGTCDHKAMLDLFYESGGNFIDTWVTSIPSTSSCSIQLTSYRANNYQKGESERAIGEWMASKGVRDQMVVATKYTTAWRTGFGSTEIIVNTGGNGAKSLRTSVEESLRNLQTSYIDLVGFLLYRPGYDHWLMLTIALYSLVGLHVLYS